MRKIVMGLCLCLGLGLGLALPVIAADLEAAKASGQLGEQIDGFLGLVDAKAPADIQAMMKEINAKRLAKYGEIAASRGVPVEAVGKIAAKKVYDSAPAGTYFKDASGSWKRK